jgi:hypothetical protein
MKTPGELALMFMGINKIAHDLLIENPMTGYMNEIIFTRILGNDDILEATTWKDCSQCYMCEKHKKIEIKYQETDSKIMKQSVLKLEGLQKVMMEYIMLQQEQAMQKVDDIQIKAMYDSKESYFDNSQDTQIQEKQTKKSKVRSVSLNDNVIDMRKSAQFSQINQSIEDLSENKSENQFMLVEGDLKIAEKLNNPLTADLIDRNVVIKQILPEKYKMTNDIVLKQYVPVRGDSDEEDLEA